MCVSVGIFHKTMQYNNLLKSYFEYDFINQHKTLSDFIIILKLYSIFAA